MYPPLKRPPPVTPRTPAPTRPKLMNPSSGAESLQVFCRLRPTEDGSCIQVVSDNTIRLTLPESSISFRPGACKEYQYSFKKIFTETNTQKEVFNVVARPLVENLIRGKNGLLFTYGVTGSGKTHTMAGHENSVGILPRCLDVLFNTISDYQAKKYVFKPDRMNGFEAQSEADALKEQEEVLRNIFSKSNKLKKNQSNENLTDVRSKDDSKLSVVEEDNAYSVFVTYIEIYNNIVYDLLENLNESDVFTKLQSKIIREDSVHNMYVHGVTEVEVKSADEAYDVFRKGQKRKRVEHTNLNKESSRSHSIFTIRLVQAPLDATGENVLQDKRSIGVSQLSLVDLAGSERTNRTNNCGQRLREAGNINNSLMTLRKCLEILRENQQTGSVQKIPHREQRLTHLFKKFFDGEGDIRMIVCVNPGVADYDETIQVLKFAEVSQEIQVKPTPARPDALKTGLTPGRRRAHQLFLEKRQNLEKRLHELPAYVPNDVEAIYCLEPFPCMENFDFLDTEANSKLSKFLQDRIQKKTTLITDFENRCERFRAELLKQEENMLNLRQEYDAVNAQHECDLMKTRALEEKVLSLDANSSNMKRRCERFEDEIKSLKRALDEKDTIIAQVSSDKERSKRAQRKIAAKADRLSKEKENEFKEKQQMQIRMEDTNKQLLRVKKALAPHDDNSPSRSKVAKYDDFSAKTEITDDWTRTETTSSLPIKSFVSPTKSIAVSNQRHGRTRLSAKEEWLDHRTVTSVPLNTVMQPMMKRRRSFTTVTSPKEVTKTSKYCLMTHNQDEDGMLETQLYKGDVVPTCSGGAQIILNDMETLKQTSPVTSPSKLTLVKSPSQTATAAIAASSSSAKYPDLSSIGGGSSGRK